MSKRNPMNPNRGTPGMDAIKYPMFPNRGSMADFDTPPKLPPAADPFGGYGNSTPISKPITAPVGGWGNLAGTRWLSNLAAIRSQQPIGYNTYPNPAGPAGPAGQGTQQPIGWQPGDYIQGPVTFKDRFGTTHTIQNRPGDMAGYYYDSQGNPVLRQARDYNLGLSGGNLWSDWYTGGRGGLYGFGEGVDPVAWMEENYGGFNNYGLPAGQDWRGGSPWTGTPPAGAGNAPKTYPRGSSTIIKRGTGGGPSGKWHTEPGGTAVGPRPGNIHPPASYGGGPTQTGGGGGGYNNNWYTDLVNWNI